MNVFFIDDTEQVRKCFIGIGGVIFSDVCIGYLYSIFAVKKQSHGIPPAEEIKWSPDKDSWIARNLRDDKRLVAYSDILGLIRQFKGRQIVAVFRRDKPSCDVRRDKWECIRFITERFQFFLQTQQDKNGIIIADFPGSGTEEKKLLSDYHELLDKGTEYVKPLNIVMNLLTTESHLSPALQLADLVVGITTAMCSTQKKYAKPYWAIVKSNFHRNPYGQVMGCGLKLWPKDMTDKLHQELFREDFEDDYQEYRERMRYLYSQIMSDEEVDLHFP